MAFDSIKEVPKCKKLRKYIEYYWIGDNFTDFSSLSPYVNSYPGITPELLIPLHGYSEHNYLGKTVKSHKPTFYGFIYNKVISNISTHQRFVLITFKSKALSSIIPFCNYNAAEILRNPVVDAESIFGSSINDLQKRLKELPVDCFAYEIDTWLSGLLKSSKSGFLDEIGDIITKSCSVKNLIDKTNSSYSTIERYFKKETGLTPKQFLIYKRFCSITSSIIQNSQSDWIDHIYAYNFYDQSHFIKEIKKYSGHTPSELINIPSLVQLRPDISFMTNFYNEVN